ncbi:C40 family peptidase [Yaniella flava]|uniref:C40 family peptidase n=1 Tax=Yaniella flava TaxID=287930 RepID=A0ABP5GCC2_9MICC
MTYTTRRARIEAEKAELIALRSRRNKKFSMGIAGLATAASASIFGMAPANAAIEDVPAQSSTTSSSTTSSAGTYTVQAGDTLSSIANAQGVSLNDLMNANGLSASSIIYPGDQLQLSGGGSATTSTASTSDSGTGDSTGIQTASTTSATSSSGHAAADAAVDIVNSGVSYQYGATGPSAYDCSGLTSAAFAQAGIDLPRTSSAQYSGGQKVSLDNLQAGDLVFWSSNGSASGIYHVAVYVGDGQIAQARNPQSGVSIDSLDSYSQHSPPLNTAARY